MKKSAGTFQQAPFPHGCRQGAALRVLLASHGVGVGAQDLGALLHCAAWVMASARVLVASSASNLGALLFALAGTRSAERWGAPAVIVDNEERAKLRLTMADLAKGYYYCRQDWGMRRFGLCAAGQQSRPLKTW